MLINRYCLDANLGCVSDTYTVLLWKLSSNLHLLSVLLSLWLWASSELWVTCVHVTEWNEKKNMVDKLNIFWIQLTNLTIFKLYSISFSLIHCQNDSLWLCPIDYEEITKIKRGKVCSTTDLGYSIIQHTITR